MATVSIVIPTRNRLEYLKRAIQSVCQQTYSDWELIIIDDNSCDGTLLYLQECAASDTRISFIHNSVAGGGASARNKGIYKSTGKWVAFLDDDDLWYDTKLEEQLALLNTHTGSIAVTCNYVLLREHGCNKIFVTYNPKNQQELLLKNTLGGASVCICSQQILKDIKGFDESLCCGQDWDLWIKLNKKGPIVHINKVLVQYEVYSNARITQDRVAQYKGKRRIYNNYKTYMCRAVRNSFLYELYFLRIPSKKNYYTYRWAYIKALLATVSSLSVVKKILFFLPRVIRAMLTKHVTFDS